MELAVPVASVVPNYWPPHPQLVPAAAAAFQGVVAPDERRQFKLVRQVIDSSHRQLLVAARESALQLEELQQYREAQSPLLYALIRKLLPVAALAPELSEFSAAAALIHPSLPPK